jgi:FtsP/CotA-like multicopper oxidase with cupredoxin domain
MRRLILPIAFVPVVFRANLVAACLIVAGCRSATPTVAIVPPLDDSPGLTPAVDINPDPHIFEFNLEAKLSTTEYVTGKTTPVWSYNGTVPGPLIDVSVGDTLVIHFKNSLPQATTIHWHGIRLPNAMDGTLATQDPIPPGGTFEYRFTLKDQGLYWFHPHHRSDSQTERGLYGVIRVRGTNEPTSDHEHVWVLDDLRIDASGALPPDLDNYELLSTPMKIHGRSGPTLLVNGRANRTLELQPGAIHRFRVLNTANLRYFNLAIPGHRWRVIGTDGGLFPHPYDVDNLVIGPAERYDALLIPTAPSGSNLTLRSDAFDRAEDDPQLAGDVATLHMSAEPTLTGRTLPEVLQGVTVAPVDTPSGEPLPIEFDSDTIGGASGFTLPTMDHHGDPVTALPGDPVFVINKKAGMDIPSIDLPRGVTKAFLLHNVSHQIHLFHLHGFFFRIVETDDMYDAKLNPGGLRPEMITQARKDTITVRSGYSVKVVATFDSPGTWMYHCHIPEHSERGMMGEIRITP